MKPFSSPSACISWRQLRLAILLPVILGGLCFANSLNNSLLNWDDQVYISENPYIRTLSVSTIEALFSRPYFKNYAPIHVLSYQVDYHLFGFHPHGYRLINILLHILNSVLIFFLILECYPESFPAALAAAAIFAVHTIHVESVVWLSQRKDVLSAFFFLLSLHGYIRFRKKAGWPWYGLSLGLFSLALLTKPIAVTLPLVLVLYELCFQEGEPAGRWRNVIPFFLLAGLAAAATCWAQYVDSGIKQYVGHSPLSSLLLTGKILILYLGKLLLPVGLSNRYVFLIERPSDLLTPSLIFSWALVLLLLAGLIRLWRYKRELAFPGCWFLITLLPMANLIPTSTQMADRYLYLPSLGYCLAAGLLIQSLGQRVSQGEGGKFLRWIQILVAGGVVMVYGSLTLARNRVWRDDQTLWEDALAQNPDNYHAAAGLANALLVRAQKERYPVLKKQYLDQALRLLQQALAIKPDFALAHLGMGNVLIEGGKIREAIPFFREARRRNDERRYASRIEYNLAVAYLKSGQRKAAEKTFASVIRQDPDFALAYLSLGTLYFDTGTRQGYRKAEECYLRAAKADPDNPRAFFYLGIARERLGDISSAIESYQQSLRLATADELSLLNPADIHLNLAGLYYRQQDYQQAVEHYRQVLALDPDNSQAQAVRSILLSLGLSE
ncbi:MAG: tetratricopeptide repeat protein [bacterium]